MTIIHPVRTDLVRPGVTPRVYAMQFDTNTRVVELTLTAQGEPWIPPQDSAFALSYRKPDGTRGFYNELSQNVSAVTLAENRVSVTLAPQVLTAAGTVEAALILSCQGKRAGAFPFQIHVAADPSGGSEASDDFFQVGGGTASAPIKGLDYFTPEEKAEMVQEVLSQVLAQTSLSGETAAVYLNHKNHFIPTEITLGQVAVTLEQ